MNDTESAGRERLDFDPDGVTSYFCLECWRTHHKWRGQVFIDHIEHAFTVPKEWKTPLADAALNRQKTVGELVEFYVRQGLRSDGIDPETGELYTTGRDHSKRTFDEELAKQVEE